MRRHDLLSKCLIPLAWLAISSCGRPVVLYTLRDTDEQDYFNLAAHAGTVKFKTITNRAVVYLGARAFVSLRFEVRNESNSDLDLDLSKLTLASKTFSYKTSRAYAYTPYTDEDVPTSGKLDEFPQDTLLTINPQESSILYIDFSTKQMEADYRYQQVYPLMKKDTLRLRFSGLKGTGVEDSVILTLIPR